MSCNTSVTRVQVSSVGQAQRTTVHLMPCEIEHDGPAQVSQYITATTKDHKHGNCRICLISCHFQFIENNDRDKSHKKISPNVEFLFSASNVRAGINRLCFLYGTFVSKIKVD